MAFLFTFSLLIRLLTLAVFPAPALDDSARIYLNAAGLLMDGKGFSDSSFPVYNPPLYPAFIAICLSLLGNDQLSVAITQAVIDSLTSVIVYSIMRQVFDTATGLLAGCIYSIYPFSIYLAMSIASEPLFTFLLGGFVLFTVYAVRSHKLLFFCASGVLLGLATLVRATTQFVPLLFILMLILVKKRTPRTISLYIAFSLSFILVVLPWTLRNYIVLHDFIPVATGGGIVVLMGSSEKFLTIDGKSDMFRDYPPLDGNKPSENDKNFTRAGLEKHKIYLKTDPWGYIAFMARKFLRLWYATESGYNHGIILFGQIPMYIFALVGIVLAWTKGKTLSSILLILIIYFAVLHWIALPLFRYMVPIVPYLIGFGSFALITLKDEWTVEKEKSAFDIVRP